MVLSSVANVASKAAAWGTYLVYKPLEWLLYSMYAMLTPSIILFSLGLVYYSGKRYLIRFWRRQCAHPTALFGILQCELWAAQYQPYVFQSLRIVGVQPTGKILHIGCSGALVHRYFASLSATKSDSNDCDKQQSHSGNQETSKECNDQSAPDSNDLAKSSTDTSSMSGELSPSKDDTTLKPSSSAASQTSSTDSEFEIHGLDHSDAVLDWCKSDVANLKSPSVAVFHHGSSESDLSFTTGYFDTIVAFDMLYLIKDIDNTFREWIRCLKKGGKLVLGFQPLHGFVDDDWFNASILDGSRKTYSLAQVVKSLDSLGNVQVMHILVNEKFDTTTSSSKTSQSQYTTEDSAAEDDRESQCIGDQTDNNAQVDIQKNSATAKEKDTNKVSNDDIAKEDNMKDYTALHSSSNGLKETQRYMPSECSQRDANYSIVVLTLPKC